jgi:hypothetical protein
MSEVLGYIADGYTEEAILHAVPRLFPQVCFSYRPMQTEECTDFRKASEKLVGMELRRLAAGYLSSHLKSWDVKDAKGAIVKIDSASLLRLKEGLFNRLFAVVMTTEAPDDRPSASEEEKQADFADVLKAAETDQTVAQVREAREVKN